MQGTIDFSIEQAKQEENNSGFLIGMNGVLLDSQAQHDPKTGVPPPDDLSEEFNDTSYSSSVFSDDSQQCVNQEKLEIIKASNDNFQQKLKESLLAFKQANKEFIENDLAFVETQSDYQSFLDVKKELHSIQIQILQSENQILKSEKEKIQLESKIEEIQNKNLSKGICFGCIIF